MSDTESETNSSTAMLEGLNLKALLSSGLPSDDDPEIAPELPGFEIVESIGQGGMGSVFLAKQLSLDRLVAIKVLRVHHSITGAQRTLLLSRLESEARVMAKLNHPNLVSVYDFVELTSDDAAEADAAIIMEYVPGGNVSERFPVSASELVEVEEVIKVAENVSSCLDAAHGVGVVHRDIKPENLLVNDSGVIKVSDFGLALDGSSARMTASGVSVGSPGYSAPEQLDGLETDERADLFSLGVVMYEMLTGVKPLGDVKPLREVRSDIPQWLGQLIMHCLQPDREKRVGSVSAFRKVLSNRNSETRTGLLRKRWRILAALLIAWLLLFSLWAMLPRGDRAAPIEPARWAEPLRGTALVGRWQQRPDGYHSSEGICLLGFSKAPDLIGKTVRVEFTRSSGILPIALFFQHPNGIGTVLVDAYRIGLGGLEVVNGETLRESPNAFPFSLENGQRYVLEVQVEEDSITTKIDGEVKQGILLSEETLSVAEDWRWPESEAEEFSLIVGSFKTPYAVHSVTVVPTNP